MLLLAAALLIGLALATVAVPLLAAGSALAVGGAGAVLALGLPLLALLLLWRVRWLAVLVVLVGPLLLVAIAAGCLLWGELVRGHHVEVLQAAIEQHRGLRVTDRAGRAVAVIPLRVGSSSPAYLALPLGPEAVPPVWWHCAAWLEDRSLHAPWHIAGVDLLGVVRAYKMSLIRRREGGSTIEEMVARELLDLHPHPRAPVWQEVPRKLTSWSYGPAVHHLYPDEASLAGAAATWLPLVVGSHGSRFGTELHGLARASGVVFGKPPETLDAAEQAVLAAAIKWPVVVPADSPAGLQVAAARFALLRTRAAYCLAGAPLPPGTDRAAALARLSILSPPASAQPATQPAIATASLFATPTTLGRVLGSGWRQRVTGVQVSRLPPQFPARFIATLHMIERRASGLQIPLWDGPDHAQVLAAVAGADGALVLEIGNDGASVVGFGPQPIASLGKIAAAITLGAHNSARTVYRAPDGPAMTATEAFAHSASAPIFARLAKLPDSEVAGAFQALGWPVPPPGSARYNAAFGAIEVRPEAVLRATVALTGALARQRLAVPLPHAVSNITLADGRTVQPAPSPLPDDVLNERLTPKTRGFVATVLHAPIASGTMRNLADLESRPGVAHLWGKTGSGNAADGSRTRVMWQAGGLMFHDQPFGFVLLVAEPTAGRSAASTPRPSRR